MKTGYDQFFKQAKKVAAQNTAQGTSRKPAKKSAQKFSIQEKSKLSALNLEDELNMELELRKRMNLPNPKVKKKNKTPWALIGFSFIGSLTAFWGYNNLEDVEKFLSRIEIGIYGSASAQTAPAAAPASAPAAAEAPAAASAVEGAATEASRTPSAEDDIAHLLKIKEKKKELDAKEEELARVEQELALQKVELDKRMKELEEMRAKISVILEERVKADSNNVETLVQVYTNMKPVQAAKVIETIDEDLAVEILSRMKKKSAADIMNMIKPEKAQIFTEKLAGFKK